MASLALDLDREAVVRTLDTIGRRRGRKDGGVGKPPRGAAMTGRTAAYGRAAFAWAVKRGAVHTNPFAALPVRKGIAKRERVLSDAEVAEIWRAAGDAASPYGTIVRLLILTGQRRGEVAGMTWGEISEDLATWTLPGERTKNGATHSVPLSARLRAISADDSLIGRTAHYGPEPNDLIALPTKLPKRSATIPAILRFPSSDAPCFVASTS